MRILITSFDFAPIIGGLQTAGDTLARGLAARGHDVTVVTATPGYAQDAPFKIVRRPSAGELLKLVYATDFVWQNHISLRFLWPALIARKPLVIMHHLVLTTDVGSGPEYGAIKRLACLFGQNAYVSDFLRQAAGIPGPVLYNSYDSSTFQLLPQVPRRPDVVFLGRLQPYKGADILIDALALLATRGQPVRATIIGGGPQDAALKAQASALDIADNINFTGPLQGEQLAAQLNGHRVLALPARADEAFSITALEGIACGCVIAGTESGGLPEAIGPCGLIVPQDNPAALADALETLLSDDAVYEKFRNSAPDHLARFSESALIDVTEALISKVIASKGGRSVS